MCVIDQTPKRIKCSNKDCDHIYIIVDNLHPIINDPGYVVKRCPKCGALVRIKVNNVDDFKLHDDTDQVCDFDFDYPQEVLSIPEGEELVDESITLKATIWSPGDWQEIWVSKGKNRANLCDKRVQRKIRDIDKWLDAAYQAHMAGQLYIRDPKWLLMKVHEPQKPGKYGIYSKPIFNERDISSNGLHLIHHSGVDLATSIDGLYTRDEAITIMNTCFKRWDTIGQLIIVATPFVGFSQKTQRNEKQIIKYWQWLGDVLDMDKTVFITRKSTFTLRKNSGVDRMQDVSFLKEWGKLNKLTVRADEEAARKKPRKRKNAPIEKRVIEEYPAVLYNEKFHAKFYAGVLGDTVEVLVGSYNVHEGVGLENLSFKRYPLPDFLEKYTNRLLPEVTFTIPELEDCQATMLLIDKLGKVSIDCKNRFKFLNECDLLYGGEE